MQATVLETHGQEEKEKNRMIASREYRLKGGFFSFVCLFLFFVWGKEQTSQCSYIEGEKAGREGEAEDLGEYYSRSNQETEITSYLIENLIQIILKYVWGYLSGNLLKGCEKSNCKKHLTLFWLGDQQKQASDGVLKVWEEFRRGRDFFFFFFC